MYSKTFHSPATTVGAARTLEGLFIPDATALPAAVQGYVAISPISGDATPHCSSSYLLCGMSAD